MAKNMEDQSMPRTNKPNKIEVKISISQTSVDFAERMATAKATQVSELYRQAVERGLTAIAQDETSRNVWEKTSLRGELGRLISGMDDEQMKRAIAVLKEV